MALIVAVGAITPHVPLPRMNLLLPVVELVKNAIPRRLESGAYARATVAESPGALPPAVFAEIVDRAWASRDDWTHISSPPNPLGFFVWGATFNFDNAQTPHEYGSERGVWTPIAWLRSALYFLPRWRSHETTGAVLPAPPQCASLAVHPCVAWPLLRAAYAAQLGVSADRIFFGGEVGAGAPCGIRHLSGPSVQICRSASRA